jgi:hypothetical protein
MRSEIVWCGVELGESVRKTLNICAKYICIEEGQS